MCTRSKGHEGRCSCPEHEGQEHEASTAGSSSDQPKGQMKQPKRKSTTATTKGEVEEKRARTSTTTTTSYDEEGRGQRSTGGPVGTTGLAARSKDRNNVASVSGDTGSENIARHRSQYVNATEVRAGRARSRR